MEQATQKSSHLVLRTLFLKKGSYENFKIRKQIEGIKNVQYISYET